MNADQLFRQAAELPAALSLEEATERFLDPVPLPPVRPWYLNPYLMLTPIFTIITLLIVPGTPDLPELTAFRMEASTSEVAAVKTISLPDAPLLTTEEGFVASPLLKPSYAPATAPDQTLAERTPSGPEAIATDTVPGQRSPSGASAPKANRSTPGKQNLFQMTGGDTKALIFPSPLLTLDSLSPIRPISSLRPLTGESLPDDWGLATPGRTADTITLDGQHLLTVKGRIRLMFDKTMPLNAIAVYRTPTASFRQTWKNRRIRLVNECGGETIDVAVNGETFRGIKVLECAEIIMLKE